MARIQNVCGKAILICLIPILVGLIIYDGITLFKGLTPIYEVKEAMVHLRFNIAVLRYQEFA